MRSHQEVSPVSQHYFFRLSGGLGTGSAYCFSDLQVLKSSDAFVYPSELPFLRPPVRDPSREWQDGGRRVPARAQGDRYATHSVLSHIKGQNARDSRFEPWDAPPNSPPPELFTTNDTFSIPGFEWHG